MTRFAIVFLQFLPLTSGFSFLSTKAPFVQRYYRVHIMPPQIVVPRMAGIESDFPSAMPEKPAASLKERLTDSAESFVSTVRGSLGEGVEEPPELIALDKACKDDGSSPELLSVRMYELMIESGMRYDKDPETGILTPTNFVDIKGSLDVPEVKQEFNYLYRYGISLITSGLIDEETIKEIVQERLIKRTGLSPEEFDSWLGF